VRTENQFWILAGINQGGEKVGMISLTLLNAKAGCYPSLYAPPTIILRNKFLLSMRDMAEKQTGKSIQKLEQAEIKKLVEGSRRMVDKTKKFVTELEEDIERQEKLLAKQRKDLNRLLDNLGIEKD
jgi:hypothetical protein